MKNYVICDKLNPNAINSRYSRPAVECNRLRPRIFFSAATLAEAEERLQLAIETGLADYNSEVGAYERINAKLFTAKEFFRRAVRDKFQNEAEVKSLKFQCYIPQ